MTIKEFIGKAEYDQSGTMVIGINGDEVRYLADIRGWGKIQNLFKEVQEAEKFHD